MKRGILTLLVLGLGIVTITSDISAKTPVESLVERLPDNTLGFIATSGGDYLAEPFSQSMLGQLWHDPGVQEFFRQIKHEIAQKFKNEAEIDPGFQSFWDQYLPMIKKVIARPIIFGVSEKPDTAEGEVPLYCFVIMDATGCRNQYDQFLQEIHSKADEGDIAQKKIAGYMMFTDPDEKELVYWGWVNQYFIFAINDDHGLAMKYLSEPVNRPAPKSLAALHKVKASGDALVLHVDLQKIWQQMCTGIFKQEKDRNRADQVLQILGLNQLGTLTGRFGFSQQNLVFDALLETTSPHRGLLACIKPVNLAALDLVDIQASSVHISHLYLAGLYDTIMRALQETFSRPRDYQEIQQAIQSAEKQLGFPIRQGLLESLAGPMVFYRIPSGTDMENPFGGPVLLLELRDAKKMEFCLSQVENLVHRFSQGEGIEKGIVQINTVQQDNNTLHVWTIAPMALFGITPTWVISDNQLILTSHPTLAKRALRQIGDSARQTKSIRTTTGYRQVVKNLPQSILAFGYTNTPVDFRQTLMLVQRFWPSLTMAVKETGITLPAMLPTLDHLIAKMGPSYNVCWSDAVGIHSHSQGPLPKDGTSVIAGSALGVSILLPALGRAREMANRVKCASQLRGLGNAIAMYNNDFNGRNPKTLQELTETEDVHPKAFVCPSSDDEIGQCSYIYRGADLNDSVDSQMIVAYDKYDNHDGEARNVLFAGGYVERVEEEAFQELIRKDNELRRKMGLTEIPADVEPASSQIKRPPTFE